MFCEKEIEYRFRKNINSDQPAQSAQADLNRYFFAIDQPSPFPREVVREN